MELLTNCFRYPDSFWIFEGFAGLTMIFLKIFTQFTALFADSLRFFKTIWQLWGLYRDYLGIFWLLWLFGISWDSFEKSWYQLFLLYRYSSDSVLHVWALRGMEAIDFQVVQHSRSFFECEVYQLNCPFPLRNHLHVNLLSDEAIWINQGIVFIIYYAVESGLSFIPFKPKSQ